MGKNARGAMAMLKVILRPKITWVGAPPSAEQLDTLHHRSHEGLFHLELGDDRNRHRTAQLGSSVVG